MNGWTGRERFCTRRILYSYWAPCVKSLESVVNFSFSEAKRSSLPPCGCRSAVSIRVQTDGGRAVKLRRLGGAPPIYRSVHCTVGPTLPPARVAVL